MANETVNYDTKTKAYVPIWARSVIKKGSASERTGLRSGPLQTSNQLFLKIVLESLFNKGLKACNSIKKETLTQAFSCEICKILKNTKFYRTAPVAAS